MPMHSLTQMLVLKLILQSTTSRTCEPRTTSRHNQQTKVDRLIQQEAQSTTSRRRKHNRQAGTAQPAGQGNQADPNNAAQAQPGNQAAPANQAGQVNNQATPANQTQPANAPAASATSKHL